MLYWITVIVETLVKSGIEQLNNSHAVLTAGDNNAVLLVITVLKITLLTVVVNCRVLSRQLP